MPPGDWDQDPREVFITELLEWAGENMPDEWRGLTVETAAYLDYAGVPHDPDQWERLTVSHDPNPESDWIVTIETADGEIFEIPHDPGLWASVWGIYDWAEVQGIDTEQEVEY